MNLRLLRESDLPDLMALKESAQWNQTEQDWVQLLRWEPEGCFGIEADGHIVASSSAACYGTELSWIGMVLTLPEYRGRGYARKLMEAAVDYAQSRVRVEKLDASDMGKPLYQSMGFVSECAIERWIREPGALPDSVAIPEVGPVRWDRELDTEVFRADRTRLLEEFARDGESAAVEGGYAFWRPGSRGPFFGPCVAESVDAARALMACFVSRYQREFLLTDLFPHLEGASEVAREFGVVPIRRLTRMVLGPVAPEMPDERIYATASFCWG